MADIRRFLDGLNQRPASTDAGISKVETQLGMRLSGEYLEFLRLTNGGEGYIGSSAYVILWGIEELASANMAYQVQKFVPGLLIFGSDGGGEAYGFDTRVAHWPIVQVPFVGMAWDSARAAGASFTAFLERLSETE